MTTQQGNKALPALIIPQHSRFSAPQVLVYLLYLRAAIAVWSHLISPVQRTHFPVNFSHFFSHFHIVHLKATFADEGHLQGNYSWENQSKF